MKIKKVLKENKKSILFLIVGLILGSVTVYATGEILYSSSQVKFDNTRAGLKKLNGDDVETVEEAIEALQRGENNSSACSNSAFHLGDYVEMTPTAISFTPDRILTGLDDYDTFKGNAQGTTTVEGTLNPSELNLWRVIRINNDCTVEMVSEYVSSIGVKFASKVGYMNYIWYLSEIAKQYANLTYTLNPLTSKEGAFREIGYDGQTPKITNATRLDDDALGTSTGAWFDKAPDMPGVEENLGGGDFKFATDLKLMSDSGVSAVAYKINTTTKTEYWLASRIFYWNSTAWNFGVRYVNSVGSIGVSGTSLWYLSNNRKANNASYPIRPIITLKPGITPASGNGTSLSHYVLS